MIFYGGREVAVEVDGPSHFFGRTPTGATALKRRQLRAAGWALLPVPYWEWNALTLSLTLTLTLTLTIITNTDTSITTGALLGVERPRGRQGEGGLPASCAAATANAGAFVVYWAVSL